MIEFGLLIVNFNCTDILDVCTEVIKDVVKDDFANICQDWFPTCNKTKYIDFLIQKDILYYTLPMVTYWVAGVANKSDLSLLLTCFENLEVGKNLRMHGERFSDLLDGLGEKIQSFDQLKRLNAIQSKNYRSLVTPTKAVEVAPVPIQDLATLLSEDYRTFSVEKMLGIEKQYSLTHFQFAEVVASWINKRRLPDEIYPVWGAVRQHELSKEYIEYLHVRLSNTCYCYKISLTFSNTKVYQYIEDHIDIRDPQDLGKPPIIEHQNKCKMCGTTCRFTATFHKDRIPCCDLEVEDSSCRVEHVYIYYYDHKYAEHYLTYSLLTDIFESFTDMWDSFGGMDGFYVNYLYKCGKNYRSPVTPTKAVEVAPVLIQDLATLLSEDYHSFSVEKMLGIEKQYSLNHFQFAEVVAAWIISYEGFDEDEIDEVWGAVKQQELNKEYLIHLRDVVSDRSGGTLLDISDIDSYQYCIIDNQDNTLEDPLKFEKIECKNRCEMCGATCRFTATLHKDRIPFYELEVEDSSCKVEHVYFFNFCSGYLSGCLLTDSYNSVRGLNAFNKYASYFDGEQEVETHSAYLGYLYKCGKQ